MMFDVHEQPRGHVLQAFRMRIIIDGKPCSRRQLADSIGSTEQNIQDYETEKKGKLMPAPFWVITRIMWDALAFEQFKKIRPKRDRMVKPKEPATELAARLEDAYSTFSYGGDWVPCIEALREAGFDDEDIEAILRSKLTRWAADLAAGEPATPQDLLRYLALERITPKTVKALMQR